MKETTSRHKIITLLKTRDKKENLENGRRKKSHYREKGSRDIQFPKENDVGEKTIEHRR